MIVKIAKIFKADRKDLLTEAFTDKIAYQILEEQADSKILRVAENKVEYLTKKYSDK